MIWIYEQVTPALLRMLHDHEYGVDLRNHLQKLLDESEITIGGEIDKNELLWVWIDLLNQFFHLSKSS